MTAELVGWGRRLGPAEASQVRNPGDPDAGAAWRPVPCHQGLGPAQLLRLAWVRQGRLTANPAGASSPQAGAALPKNLDVDRCTSCSASPTRQDPLAVRDRAIMELMYSSGLRLAELVGLSLADVKLGGASSGVIGKGSRERVLPMGGWRWVVAQVAQGARPCWPATREALFVSKRRQRLSAALGTGAARRLGSKQALQRPRPSPQAAPQLRHPHAGILRRSAGGAGAAGHAGSSTTQIYTHLDFQHLAKVYDSAHPQAKRRIRKRRRDE